MPVAALVLEGGGIKGLGLVGAATRLLEEGYAFARVAGTSSGAIAGALLAAGVDAPGLTQVMERLDYSRVPDRDAPGIPIASETISLLAKGGAHPGRYVYDWMRDELERLATPSSSRPSRSPRSRRCANSSRFWPRRSSATTRPTSSSRACAGG